MGVSDTTKVFREDADGDEFPLLFSLPDECSPPDCFTTGPVEAWPTTLVTTVGANRTGLGDGLRDLLSSTADEDERETESGVDDRTSEACSEGDDPGEVDGEILTSCFLAEIT